MSIISQIGLIIFIIATVIAMVRVLMDRRQPAKTIAWLLVLTFLPVIGLIWYIFFGQNTRKERIISQKSLDQLTSRKMIEFVAQRGLTLPEEHKQIIQLFINQGWALPLRGSVTAIYTEGYTFFPALLEAIGKARHHIHLTTYIFDDDPLGNLVADALIAKAKQGIEVRIIYDDVGSWKTRNRFFDRMIRNGIEVYPFMPVRFPAFTSKVNYRNHRKLCIIDSNTGFIGGMNIAMRYVKGTRSSKSNVSSGWRDTHLKVEGMAVSGLQCAFLTDWYFVSRILINDKRYYNSPSPGIANHPSPLLQLVSSSPTSPWPEIEQGYVHILLSARKYVFMETPYFLPTEPILFAMRTAALAGIDVRLMIPLHIDAKLVDWASRSYVTQTVEAGVKVYLYKPSFNHSKLLICDDTLATCGSTNIDFRSFENNFESNIFIYDDGVAMQLKQIFLEDQEQCVLLDDITNLEHRPFITRLWESFVRLLSPLL